MTPAARYECCDKNRRNAVVAHPTLNGLDAVEVIDRELPQDDALRQRTLLLFCVKPVTFAVTHQQVEISGGVRVRDPEVQWAAVASPMPAQLAGAAEADTAAIVASLPDPERVIIVRVARAGDYSRYRLRLQASAASEQPPSGFDPRMVQLEFSFKAECPTELDCQSARTCAVEPEPPPDIDYLARDYPTFRRLLLDRLVQKVPDWAVRSPADQGVALVELLAYLGDHLSYRQDAVATEAYLATARLRTSLRRHATLVDYRMHEGSNARVFIHLQLAEGTDRLELPAAGTRFLTRCGELPRAIEAGAGELTEALRQRPAVFAPMHAVTLHRDHDELLLYTWGDDRCCLPVGATSATLRGRHAELERGDWLLFEEVLGALTGHPGDADPRKRHVVRLTQVRLSVDPLPSPPAPITEIEWADADRLPFQLCVSASVELDGDAVLLRDVSVARGNLVLADHGEWIEHEDLGRVPRAQYDDVVKPDQPCARAPRRPVPARFRPMLTRGPVTHAAPWADGTSASLSVRSSVAEAKPSVRLNDGLFDWSVQPDLLQSRPSDRDVALEVENDGRARVRFGDDHYGRRPEENTQFTARYRVGNGAAGNLGAGSLYHVVGVDVAAITTVRNPLPATGGVDPEPAESVRRRAPEAFRTLERAVTTEDYAALSERHPGVQRASARMRWTGSWHTVFVTVDPVASTEVDAATRAALVKHLDRYRMAGHDLALEGPVYVTLKLALHVCVDAKYFRAHVRAAIAELLSARTRADGQRGLFHPDNLTFGQVVYLSKVLAAIRGIAGVSSVSAMAFGRQAVEDPGPLETGRLVLGAREIARFDNDPNFPEFGALVLELHGGK